MKKIVTLFIFSFFVLSFSSSLMAEEKSRLDPSVKEMVEDALWIRPLGVIRVVLEGAAFVISLPVTKPFNKVDEASEFLINDPYSFTFERPLGEMWLGGLKPFSKKGEEMFFYFLQEGSSMPSAQIYFNGVL